MSHTYHHRYTLHPDSDREALLPLEISIRKPLYIFQIFTFNFIGGPVTSGIIPIIKGTVQTAFGGIGASVISHEWSTVLYTVHSWERRHAIKWARLIILFHLIILLCTV
jgi:hypothetical protein